ncbi:uncharacterized protein LOC117644498 [Thrips palmi]|uniref:Uncharacterized protein LOC117644498 n=1 Tax=Thrips palmi TaxID=161013 RepID=A0A6P8YS90_THRPL|nr:uncharacterized protein LOC117644498 [Thrips palmi]
MGHPTAQSPHYPMGYATLGHAPHHTTMHPDDPRRQVRAHEDPAGGTVVPMGPPKGQGMPPPMGPPMTTIIGSGGGVLNRIRNNNDPDLIISRAEVVLKPLNTSRC